MSTETIEGTAVEVEDEPVRAVVVAQPGQIVTSDAGPEGPAHMLAQATVIANALADVVERKRLYATISGRKFPQVEAWMTIGRMDNVVAREASRPTLNDDGSWEAEVELVRLSDGMVIGNASAMCGAPGDKPWDSRPSHQRRSMAVTRATSRAFRQQYSWIMVLAGYEPTPADEMPSDGDDKPRVDEPDPDGSLIGKVAKGKPPVDYEIRQTPEGPIAGFALVEGRTKLQVLASGPLADALAVWLPQLTGVRVKVWGTIAMIPWDKDGKPMPPYKRVQLDRIETPDFTLPAPADVAVAPGQETLPLTDDEKAAIAGTLTDGPYA